MSVFVIAMIAGLGGLALMALQGGRHGAHRSGHARGHLHLHVGGHAPPRLTRGIKAPGAHGASPLALRLMPDPRLIFSFVALFGAAGNILQHAAGLSLGWASLGASVAAMGLEAGIVAPLYRFALRFQGRPASPLAGLVLETGEAVTPFRNGKGIVQVIRDGRTVQLAARLKEDQKTLPVRVGDTLRIEDVDSENEKVTVSIV